MKHILLISEYFAPINSMGAIRFTKIAKYLSKNSNYKVTVLASDSIKGNTKENILLEDLKDIEKNETEIIRISVDNTVFFRFRRKMVNRFYPKLGRFESHRYAGKKFAQNALKEMKKREITRPDVIISTFGNQGGHCLAEKIKRRYGKQIKWIADFRDPLWGMSLQNKYVLWQNNKFLKKINKRADYITFVSEGCHEVMPILNNNIKIISNGYDFEECLHSKKTWGDKRMHMAYTGLLYDLKGDITPLFKVMQELKFNNQINCENIIFDYAGPSWDNIYHQAKQYKMDGILVNHGMLSREKALEIQDMADICVSASWNYEDSKGIVTGKIFEYLRAKKYIICCVSGRVPNSAIKQLIVETNSGICYEEGKSSEDYVVLKKEFVRVYQEWKNNTYIPYCGENIALQKYSYDAITREFEQLFSENSEWGK